MHGATISTTGRAADELVGRAPFIDYVARLMAPTSPVRAVLLHGAAGIGKSALGAAITERWRADGGLVEAVSAGSLRPRARQTDRTAPRLLLVDAGAAPLPTDAAAWFALLFSLRTQDRVLILARVAVPLPLDGARVAVRRVGGLAGDDADALLARHGVALDRRTAVAQWAAGSPLH
ncbi:MAG: ATP-binding protein, partial [Solirubrobacteraceae bacterium]|nr:ATP-binding protein [Patulibacter sp.]